MKQRYLFCAFLALISGILIGAFVYFKFIIALILFAVAIVFFIFYKRLGFYGIITLITATGIIVTGLSFKSYDASYSLTGLIGTVNAVTKSDTGYTLTLENCDFSVTEEIESIGVTAYCPEDAFPEIVKPGYKIYAYGQAQPLTVRKHANPGSINPEISLMAEGIYYYLYADEISVLEAKGNLNYYFSLLKQEIRQVIFNNVDSSDSAAVLYAMLTGDRSYISADINNVFSSCGTSHLLAVSGLHVGILINLIYFCLKQLRLNNVVSLVFIAIFVVIYALFTGLSPSVLRASVMAIILSFASSSANRYDSVNALGLAGIFILILSPFTLFDIAFQLSFCACFGIMVFTKYQIASKYRILNSIVNSFLITFGATVFTMPLQLYYFGTASIVSLLTNILFVSVASFGLMLCFLFTLLSFLWQGFVWFIKIPGFILKAVILLSKIFAKAPLVDFAPVSAIIIILILGFLVFFTRFIRVKKKLVAGVLLIAVTLCSLGAGFYNNNVIKIKVPYLEKGLLCTHIEGKDTYVFGLSTNNSYFTRNTKNIDYLFLITQQDINYLEALDESIKIENIYVSPKVELTKRARMLNVKPLETVLTLKDGKVYYFENGIIFINGENKIFIGDGARNEIYTLAITNDLLVRAKTVISNGTAHTFNQKFYDIKYNGYTSVTLSLRRYNEPYRVF